MVDIAVVTPVHSGETAECVNMSSEGKAGMIQYLTCKAVTAARPFSSCREACGSTLPLNIAQVVSTLIRVVLANNL